MPYDKQGWRLEDPDPADFIGGLPDPAGVPAGELDSRKSALLAFFIDFWDKLPDTNPAAKRYIQTFYQGSGYFCMEECTPGHPSVF